MPNNGTGQTLAEKLMTHVAQKWDSVIQATKAPLPEAPKPPQPTREQIIEREISGWASETPEAFFAWIDNVLETTAIERAAAVDSHGKLAYFTGMQEAFSLVRERFSAWRNKPSRPTSMQGE